MFKKFFASLLTYAIGFQLMVGAIPNTPVSWVAYGQSCASGLQWNSTLQRCLSTEQAAKVQEANAECMKKNSPEEQKACLNASLMARVQEAEDKGEISKHKKSGENVISVMLAMISLMAGVMAIIGKNVGDCPMATSSWLIVGSSVAVLAGEVMSANIYEKKSKEAEDELKKISGSASSDSSDNARATDTQASSFEALIKKEDATISAAKMKNNLYMVATAGYAAALGFAIYEQIEYTAAVAKLAYPPTTAIGAAIISMLTCKITSSASMNMVSGDDTMIADSSSQRIDDSTDPLAELKKSQEIYINGYLANFFENKQGINFKTYTNAMYDNRGRDFLDLYYQNKNLELMHRGQVVSASIDHYEYLRVNARHVTEGISAEQLTFMKLAKRLAQEFTITPAHAFMEGIGKILAMVGVAAIGGVAMMYTQARAWKALFLLPMTRITLSGIMIANNAFMIMHTNKEKKKAEERKSFMEKLKQQVLASGQAFGCTSADRNSNLSKPQCYCYQEGGTLNPSRSKSATCKQYFGSNPNLASNTLNKISTAAVKSCADHKGNADTNCNCRTTNTCAKVPTNLASNIPGGTSLLGNLPATLNGLNSGALNAADVDTASMNALAAKSKKLQEKLLNNPKNKGIKKDYEKAMLQASEMMDSMRRDLAGSTGAATTASVTPSFNTGMNPSDALEKMKSDLKQEIKGYEGGVVNMNGNAGAAKKDEFSLDGLNAGGVTIADEGLENQEKLDEIMAAQYEMGDSEINSDPGANIFQILTNRYQRSGMRRLFGAEKVVPADKPAKTPIAQ
ncbi:MAG: hypothetical protein ACLGG0_12055 [Bacteriovoracia bacterium]